MTCQQNIENLDLWDFSMSRQRCRACADLKRCEEGIVLFVFPGFRNT